MKKLAALALVALSVSGCAIHQTVKPVESFTGKQICLIENSSVRAGFVESYKRALESKGYIVRRLPSSAAITECSAASTYNALWRWDLALYMAYADIRVYRDGKLVGEAKYDSQSGGMNTGKWIDADKKIVELVHQLFPGGAGI